MGGLSDIASDWQLYTYISFFALLIGVKKLHGTTSKQYRETGSNNLILLVISGQYVVNCPSLQWIQKMI